MFSPKMYIYTNKPIKVLFALTKLMTDEVTRIDGTKPDPVESGTSDVDPVLIFSNGNACPKKSHDLLDCTLKVLSSGN
jgi:hypothetical protein